MKRQENTYGNIKVEIRFQDACDTIDKTRDLLEEFKANFGNQLEYEVTELINQLEKFENLVVKGLNKE